MAISEYSLYYCCNQLVKALLGLNFVIHPLVYSRIETLKTPFIRGNREYASPYQFLYGSEESYNKRKLELKTRYLSIND